MDTSTLWPPSQEDTDAEASLKIYAMMYSYLSFHNPDVSAIMVGHVTLQAQKGMLSFKELSSC